MAGEIVGLGVVEQQVQSAILDLNISPADGIELIATAIPDSKKGEAIILLCTAALEFMALKQQLLGSGCSPLTIPSQCYQIESIPKLGSGKTDFKQVKELAMSLSTG